MSLIAKRLGQRIRSLRKKANLTQDSLAELADLSGKHIGEIERGGVNLTVQALEQIANALKISTLELLNYDHEADVDELRSELINYLTQCPSEDLKIAYRLISVVRW